MDPQQGHTRVHQERNQALIPIGNAKQEIKFKHHPRWKRKGKLEWKQTDVPTVLLSVWASQHHHVAELLALK